MPQQGKREYGELMTVCKCFRPEGTHMTSANSLLARNNHIGNKLISKGAVKFRGTHRIIIMTSAKLLNFYVNLMI